MRSSANRVMNWTGIVHYADDGRPACGSVSTSSSWMQPTIATVTCARCIAQFGHDEPGHVHDTPGRYSDEHAARRAAERAARRAAI